MIPLGFLGIWCSCCEIFKENAGLLWALLRDCKAFLRDCVAFLTALTAAEVSADAFRCVCV